MRTCKSLILTGQLYSVLLCTLLIMGCSSSTTSSARTKIVKRDRPTLEKENETLISVDTVQWTFNSEATYPPITVSSSVASYALEKVKKEHYQIALLLPMRIKQVIPELDLNNKKFAEFYAGIKMAAERQSNISAHIKVYYTNREEDKLSMILNDMSHDMPDLIVASYESKLIKKTAAFALENRIPLISPWKSSKSIADDNLFYLQMRPGIEHYYQRILDHVNYNFDEGEIVIIQREDGQDKVKTNLMQQLHESSSALPLVNPIKTFDVSIDSLMDAEVAVFDTALVDGVKAFVLPHYASKDESFVYTCIRKLYGEKADREFYIYTMPLALNSNRIDVNMRKNVNIRAAEFRFPITQNMEVQKFRKQFYNDHGSLPTKDAYYGYDLMSFIIYGLINHGQYFHYFMAGEDLELMQMKIHIQPFYKTQEDKDSGNRPDFMVNDHLYILEYNEDRFEVNDIR